MCVAKVIQFPYLGGKQKEFTGSNVGCQRNYSQLMNFAYFSLALFERYLAFRFNISEQVVSGIIIICVNFLYLTLGSLPYGPPKKLSSISLKFSMLNLWI